MKALVTGGTGFIGGALAAYLRRNGWEVNLLVRPENRNKVTDGDPYRVIEADLSDDLSHLEPALEGCDVVFHAAAIRNRWGTSPNAYWQTNVEGTRRLLFAALGIVPRFVYVSSVGVFGYPGVLGIDETFPLIPSSGKLDYHTTKAEAEALVLGAKGEIETVIARPTITYGPGDNDGMLTRLIAMLANGRFLRVGSGENHLHLAYIDDLVRGLVLLGTHPAARNETFILAGPAPTTVRDLIDTILGDLRLSTPNRLKYYIPVPFARGVAFLAESICQVANSLVPGLQVTPPITRGQIDTLNINRGFSAAKAERMLGYQARVDYPEGVKLTIEWMAAKGRLPNRLTQPEAGPSSLGIPDNQ